MLLVLPYDTATNYYSQPIWHTELLVRSNAREDLSFLSSQLDTEIAKIQALLNSYLGTHRFHNFTSGM